MNKRAFLLPLILILILLSGCGLTGKDTKSSSNVTEKHKVYCASGKGLAYSTESGLSWQHLGKVKAGDLTDDHFSSIYIVDDKTFFAGTTRGLARTTNNAETWTMWTVDSGLGGNEVRVIEKFGDTLYVGTNGGLSTSTDNASTWATYQVDDGLPVNGVNAVQVDRSTVYLGTDSGLCVSTDNMRTWSTFPITTNALVNSFFQKGDKLYISTSRGVFVTYIGVTANLGIFEKITTVGFEDFLSKNIHFFFIDNDGAWWLGTDEGLARSNNQGLGWRRFDQGDGIDSYSINDIAVKGLMVFLATNKGLAVSNDGGDAWVTYNKDEGLLSLTLKQVVVR